MEFYGFLQIYDAKNTGILSRLNQRNRLFLVAW